jgi:hypothetical protein
MEIELVYSVNTFRANSCPWSRLTAAEQKKKREIMRAETIITDPSSTAV